jgi:hypothetical protein
MTSINTKIRIDAENITFNTAVCCRLIYSTLRYARLQNVKAVMNGSMRIMNFSNLRKCYTQIWDIGRAGLRPPKKGGLGSLQPKWILYKI